MIIKKYKENNGKIIITLDAKGRNTFVYPIDRFKNLAALKKEIAKSRVLDDKKEKKETKRAMLLKELNVDIKKNKELDK